MILPLLACFFVSILFFFRVMQVQMYVQGAMEYTGRKLAVYAHLENGVNQAGETENGEGQTGGAGNRERQTGGAGSGGRQTDGAEDEKEASHQLVGLAVAKTLLLKELAKNEIIEKYVVGESLGVSILTSKFDGNYIELEAVYYVKLPVKIFGTRLFKLVQCTKCRKWTGWKEPKEVLEEDTWVYVTETGVVYHLTESCTYLDLSIHSVACEGLGNLRNESGGRYYPCELCKPESIAGAMVYITNYGDVYHSQLGCSGIKRTIYRIRLSEVGGRRLCSRCANAAT